VDEICRFNLVVTGRNLYVSPSYHGITHHRGQESLTFNIIGFAEWPRACGGWHLQRIYCSLGSSWPQIVVHDMIFGSTSPVCVCILIVSTGCRSSHGAVTRWLERLYHWVIPNGLFDPLL
jgi:hypothetical protein